MSYFIPSGSFFAQGYICPNTSSAPCQNCSQGNGSPVGWIVVPVHTQAPAQACHQCQHNRQALPEPPRVEQGLGNAPSRALTPYTPDIRLRVLNMETVLVENRPGDFYEYIETSVPSTRTVRQLIEGLGGGPGSTLIQYAKGFNGRLTEDVSIAYGSEGATWRVDSFGWGIGADREDHTYVKLQLH